MSLSPNMSLPIPTTSVTTGPTYANNINACMTLVDQHSHTPGSGVPITTAALNINAALPMNNFSLMNTAALTLTDQAGSVPSNGSFYLDGVDAWFVDGNGTPIQLTLGGLVNATSSGISSGAASAAFVAGVLVVKAASTTPANIEGASLLLGNNTANSKFLTLSPPNAMGSDYSLTLPAIPGATSIMSLDTSGNIAATYVVDNITIGISANTIGVINAGIGTAQLANSSVTNAKLNGPNSALTQSCGATNTSSSTPVQIPNFAASITSLGRPVEISFVGDGTAGVSSIICATSSAQGYIQIYRDGSLIYTADCGSGGSTIPASSIATFDLPGAGSHTYTGLFYGPTGGNIAINFAKMWVREINA